MATRVKSPDKRKALLKATLSLINNNGFHAAPMSKIAKLAKVSPATIYIYFENKQDLVNQLYLEVKSAFSEHAFQNFSDEMPVKKGFDIIWNNIADYKISLPEESNFLSQCDNTPMIDEKSRLEGLKNIEPLLNLWERGKSEGIIKNICPYILYAYAIYPLAFLMTAQQREDFELTEDLKGIALQAAWDSIKI
ncbi:TetR/AcrR family transcriptional regulator [Ancylomarina sp. 16SWW S1-10-2]|uniref:TetR/AcrR family transcriptional regulator n=1 Tax=Ancylomarina sp. 16SWW S1-10-2 TaxID=2499681 RepID=UPI0012AE619C|nr:TetR/AcrR family transcriptional regulator [Ancylomarina sp. 16SWW S1-10-2]MRT92950.1 TetR/AcrR family transcriptional regulator [Ancylomarina sp. 16SWW S1-10-2]